MAMTRSCETSDEHGNGTVAWQMSLVTAPSAYNVMCVRGVRPAF
jgi:hypothetical protein